MLDLKLDTGAVARTIDLLCRRVEERFPGSGLSRVARELDRIAKHTPHRAEAIARPILSLRIAVAVLIALIAIFLTGTLALLRKPKEPVEAFQFIQVLSPATPAGP